MHENEAARERLCGKDSVILRLHRVLLAINNERELRKRATVAAVRISTDLWENLANTLGWAGEE